MACHREKLASNVKSRGVLLSFFFFSIVKHADVNSTIFIWKNSGHRIFHVNSRKESIDYVNRIVLFDFIPFDSRKGSFWNFCPPAEKEIGFRRWELFTRECKRNGIGNDRMARDPERRSPILSLSDLCLSWEIVFDNETGETQSKAGGKSRDTRDFHRLLDLQEAYSYSRQIYTCWLEGWKHSLNISTWQIRGHVSATWIRMKIQYPPEERSNHYCHSRLIERIERIIRKNLSYEWYKSTTSATNSLILDQYTN